MSKQWIVFERADNHRIGLFDTRSKCTRAAGEVITIFEGTFEEAMAYADTIEELRASIGGMAI